MAQYLLIRQYFQPWIVSARSSRKVSLLVQHGWVGRCPTEQQSPVLLLNVRFPCSHDPSAMDAAALRSVHFKDWSPAQCDLSPNIFNVLLEVHLPSFCPSLTACRSFSRLICNKDNKFKTEEERWIFLSLLPNLAFSLFYSTLKFNEKRARKNHTFLFRLSCVSDVETTYPPDCQKGWRSHRPVCLSGYVFPVNYSWWLWDC